MAAFKCKMCGGALEIQEGATTAECLYCGTKQTLPKLDDDRRRNLYDRANHFRQNGDFDKATAIFEQILGEDNTDAEAYWSLVLCRYGVEYVEDPATHKRIPTVNRTQPTPVASDEDYKSALRYADDYQTSIYEEEAKAIDEIQRGILAVSQKEQPFDVFICYKETDATGQRTRDSVLAVDLHDQLTREGLKVFCARITLEDKLGTAYEPYIFAALNSAPVMVALGTKAEHFNAPWVRNEWSRYLSLIRGGARKTLIPAYLDMDPYDLPEEFAHLQAQDMNRLGFMQDLTRGIKKILGAEQPAPRTAIREQVIVGGNNADALVKRGLLALEDEDFKKADDFFEQALNQDAENSNAYLGKLMAELKLRNTEELVDFKTPIEEEKLFQRAIRFAAGQDRERLNEYAQNNRAKIEERIRQEEERRQQEEELKQQEKEQRYNSAIELMESDSTLDELKKLVNQLKALVPYKDTEALLQKANAMLDKEQKYQNALKQEKKAASEEELHCLVRSLDGLGNYKDAPALLSEAKEKLKSARAREAEAARCAKKKKKITLITFALIVVVVLIGCGIIHAVRVKKMNEAFATANALFSSGQYKQAMEWYRKAADLGHTGAQEPLARAVMNEAFAKANDYFSSGQYRQAVEWYRKAADLGHTGTQEPLARAIEKNFVKNNLTYGGKFLGTAFSQAQSESIRAGTLDGMALGDYWTIDGVNWRIADFDYLIRSDKARVDASRHHVMIVPDKSLYKHRMNSTNTTEGAYSKSEMRAFGLDEVRVRVRKAFGAEHILTYRGHIESAGWTDCGVELMTKEMVVGKDNPLSLFRLKSTFRLGEDLYWLQDVVSVNAFAFFSPGGNAGCLNAYLSCGVRPVFAIY